jgi:hypothetical protein
MRKLADKMNQIFETHNFKSTVHIPQKTIYQSRPKAESTIVIPLHCRGEFLRQMNLKMQNKPNFNHRHTQYDIRDTKLFMQNEPNLYTNSHKCLRNMDLQKYLHPALLLSTNIVDRVYPPQADRRRNQQSIINIEDLPMAESIERSN